MTDRVNGTEPEKRKVAPEAPRQIDNSRRDAEAPAQPVFDDWALI